MESKAAQLGAGWEADRAAAVACPSTGVKIAQICGDVSHM